MNTYSREYLQNLPKIYRKELVNHHIAQFHHPKIINKATNGETSYSIDMTEYFRESHYQSIPPCNRLTVQDIIEGFKERYVECKVEYIETWIEIKPDIKTLKKEICIDWSFVDNSRYTFYS